MLKLPSHFYGMVDPSAAAVKIVDVPRLSVARLLDLRAFLDSGVACGLGETVPEGGIDEEASHAGATGPFREAARGQGLGAAQRVKALEQLQLLLIEAMVILGVPAEAGDDQDAA